MKLISRYFFIAFGLYSVFNMYVLFPYFKDLYVSPYVDSPGGLVMRLSYGVLCGLALFYGIAVVERFVMSPLFEKAKTTETPWDDWIVEVVRYFINRGRWLLVVLVVFHLSQPLPLIDGHAQGFFFLIFGVLILLTLTHAASYLFYEVLTREAKNKSMAKQIFPLARHLVVVFIWILGGIFLLDLLGIKVTALAAGAGIGGLAIALAAQKPLANAFGAFSLLLNHPFKVGDFVRIDDNTIGAVRQIGLTYTTIEDKRGQQVFMSNDQLSSAKIENFKQREKMRGEAIIGLTYDMSGKQLQTAVDIITEIFTRYENDEKIQDWRVHFESFGDFSQNIGYHFYGTSGKYLDFKEVEQAINFEIKEKFEKAKLEFAFPTQEVIVRKS